MTNRRRFLSTLYSTARPEGAGPRPEGNPDVFRPGLFSLPHLPHAHKPLRPATAPKNAAGGLCARPWLPTAFAGHARLRAAKKRRRGAYAEPVAIGLRISADLLRVRMCIAPRAETAKSQPAGVCAPVRPSGSKRGHGSVAIAVAGQNGMAPFDEEGQWS